MKRRARSAGGGSQEGIREVLGKLNVLKALTRASRFGSLEAELGGLSVEV